MVEIDGFQLTVSESSEEVTTPRSPVSSNLTQVVLKVTAYQVTGPLTHNDWIVMQGILPSMATTMSSSSITSMEPLCMYRIELMGSSL